MNVRWGLDLDIVAVRLMRREGGHWREVARENIDGPDIEDRLVAMIGRIEGTTSVDFFLPRDQILYTDVSISSSENAEAEIDAAMEGRTPYFLSELVIDWTMTAPTTARVAAIARETLDEAAAFADARGLQVAGFSSLAEAEDFPRPPSFGGGYVDDMSTDAAPVSMQVPDEDFRDMAVAFTTVRDNRWSAPSPAVSAPTDDGRPILQVDDPTPVMQVRSSPLPPLNPGRPVNMAPVTPRVRTDIAAGTLSGAAATLTPTGPSIRLKEPSGNPQRTLLVFAVAAALTIGIAIVVWSILPLAPGRTSVSPPAESVQIVGDANTTQTAESAPDVPPPLVETETAALSESPSQESAPVLAPATEAELARAMPETLPLAPLPQETTQPAAPLEPSPSWLAGLRTEAPFNGLDGSEDATETTNDIYFASIEPGNLAFDAIALPSARGFVAESLPEIGLAPAETPETVDLAAVDPTTVPEDVQSGEPEAPDTGTATAEPEAPAAQVDPVLTEADIPASELRPTELAAALPDRAPRPRPGGFTDEIERQQFGGLTREQLAGFKPRTRPESAQTAAVESLPPAPEASELAVATSAPPRSRPRDFDAIVAAAVVQTRAEQITASIEFETPDTSAAIEAALAEDIEPEPRPQDTPRLAIPSSASVARQATIENAIPLNKMNLVGVYGVPSDRRALIRLPSGSYVKVKVGDRVDGGTVAQINDSELLYRKGSRTFSLAMPKG